MSGNGETAGSSNARQALLTAVDEHAGEAGAPVGDVIEAALEDVNGGLGRVCSALQQLHADGEVYQPNPTTVRRVATDGGNETGSPESRLEGVRKQLRLVLDDVEFEDEDAAEYVEGALACAESAAVCLEGPEVLDEDTARDHAGAGDDAVAVDVETAETCLRELGILIDETDDPENEYGDPMSPLARARSRIVALDDVDEETQREVLDVIDEVGEATGAETSPIDPLQDDIFRAKSDLEDALAAAGDGEGDAPDDGCGASVQHEHEAVDVPLDEDPAAEGGEQQ